MTVLQTKRAYVLAFGGYVLAVLICVLKLFAHATPPSSGDRFLSRSMLLGSAWCIYLLWRLFYKTSNKAEYAVIALSILFFALFAYDVLKQAGWASLEIQSERTLSVVITALATACLGIRLIQVITNSER